MTHDEILREHTARYKRMTPKEQLQQKHAFLKLPGKEPEAGMNSWTWAYLAVTAAAFGYWQNSIAAGFVVFLFLVLLTRLLYIVANSIVSVRAVSQFSGSFDE